MPTLPKFPFPNRVSSLKSSRQHFFKCNEFLVGIGGRDEFIGEVALRLGSLGFGNPRDLMRGLFVGDGGMGREGEKILSLGNGSLEGRGGLGGTSLDK